MKTISYEYIRGLVDGEGCFSFHTTTRWRKINGEAKRIKMPAFTIKMHERDERLLEIVRDTLGLKAQIYHHKAYRKDGYNRGETAELLVRDTLELRNIIIPIFYGRLHGYKGKQFIEWLEKMGEDDKIVEARYLYMKYKQGFFEIEQKEFLLEKDKNNSHVYAETLKT